MLSAKSGRHFLFWSLRNAFRRVQKQIMWCDIAGILAKEIIQMKLIIARSSHIPLINPFDRRHLLQLLYSCFCHTRFIQINCFKML